MQQSMSFCLTTLLWIFACLLGLSCQSVVFAAESINYSDSRSYPISVEPFFTAGIALGDIDIVIANVKDKNRVFLNDGTGQLSLLSEFGSAEDMTYALGLGDINGDRLPDIVAGNSGGANIVYFQIKQTD